MRKWEVIFGRVLSARAMAEAAQAAKAKGESEEAQGIIHAAVVVRSESGKSLFEKREKPINNYHEFLPSKKAMEATVSILKKKGFNVTAQGAFSFTISSSREHFEKAFGIELIQKELPVIGGTKKQGITYYTTKGRIDVPKELVEYVEAIFIPVPAQYWESATPPDPDYYHLDVPKQIADLINATACHNVGKTRKGVHVVMVDSGFYNHPYYADKGYDVSVVGIDPSYDSATDEIGHGTGIAAELLAVAPDIKFTMIKAGKVVVGMMGMQPILHGYTGFLFAKYLNPDVITCSWGWPEDWITARLVSDEHVMTLAAEVWDSIKNGVVVLFAVGNAKMLSWPSTYPSVISVGGAYVECCLNNWSAASYASSGISAFYDLVPGGRRAPDVCGICGQGPHGVLIVEPVEPACYYDQAFAGGSMQVLFPITHDGTLIDDGWLVGSGTSSATPMVAGVAALLIEKERNKPDGGEIQSHWREAWTLSLGESTGFGVSIRSKSRDISSPSSQLGKEGGSSS